MKRNLSVTSMSLICLFLIAACGAPTAAPVVAPTLPPAAAPTSTAAAAAVTIPDSAKVAVGSGSLGKFLVDGTGNTLYVFMKDSAGQSNCYDACATSWPPLVTKNKPTAGDGVDTSLLGITTRKDGSIQVTYKNMPLYYFVADKAP